MRDGAESRRVLEEERTDFFYACTNKMLQLHIMLYKCLQKLSTSTVASDHAFATVSLAQEGLQKKIQSFNQMISGRFIELKLLLADLVPSRYGTLS